MSTEQGYTVEEEVTLMQKDPRTPEQLEALRVKQNELREKIRPLMNKANRQLIRAENRFLEASDNASNGVSEISALRELFTAQQVRTYYRHLLIDIGYAFNVSDLSFHDLEDEENY